MYIRCQHLLKIFFKELESDIGIITTNGELERWATQGVLLLNIILTCKVGESNSHSHIGWEEITNCIFRTIAIQRPNTIFVLWGNNAKKKNIYYKETVIKSSHQFSFSASYGFFGSKPFSKINKYIEEKGMNAIIWN